MNKAQLLTLLRTYKEHNAPKYGISRIGLFGSFSRDEANEASDVDVVVVLEKPDYFTMAGIKNDLEESLHKSVDRIPYRESMNPFLKKRIDKEVIYV
jgi:predicted nucleotidyltransferase